MNTLLVWVLVSVSMPGSSGRQVMYSPPMPDLATCQNLEKNVHEVLAVNTRCVQIKMVVTK